MGHKNVIDINVNYIYNIYKGEPKMKLNKKPEELVCCTTIRVSLDTRALLSEVMALHFLREKEELKSYNEVIRYLYEVWRQSDE